ncbi:hypothetical protein D3C79_1086830 [compost metagenome]
MVTVGALVAGVAAAWVAPFFTDSAGVAVEAFLSAVFFAVAIIFSLVDFYKTLRLHMGRKRFIAMWSDASQ